jgi:transcriptional regulator with XRE-family HTH domain
MIKNGRQYEHSKKKLHELEEDLKAIRKKYYLDKNKVALLSQGYIEHIVQFKDEIKEYEDMIKAPFPEVLLVHNLNKISRSIVRLRIARKITQEELAQRVGCKQSDISRLERDDYYGYTIGQLDKIMAGLGVKIELNLFPKESAITEQERRERKDLKKDSELANAAYTKWITRKVEIYVESSTEEDGEISISNKEEEDVFGKVNMRLNKHKLTYA